MHQLLERANDLRQSGNSRRGTQMVAMGSGWIPRPGLTGGNVANHTGTAGEIRPRADCHMSPDASLPTDLNTVADPCGARHRGLCREEASPTDPYVVRDMHEVVELGAGADDRVVHTPPVDAAVRPHFNVVLQNAPTRMGNTQHATRLRYKTKPLATDTGSRMQRDAIPKLCERVDHGGGMHPDVPPKHRSFPNHRVGAHPAPIANHHPVPNHDQWVNRDAGTELNITADNRRGVNTDVAGFCAVKAREQGHHRIHRLRDHDAGRRGAIDIRQLG